ncbi:MAG: DUF3996 domain-containing protein [Ignavibacteriales bacterium]|nr:MAG: DUF3996 domain-containing protein [Ignavibacteriaceae bacterium]MBW7874229.1 DUF3996 domain-containing protein [Ignavibacteria bacterium]MCZ2142299.1 DUF3996 domain-containing protein [Ignavibacteriales bacterium]OQY76429.1 MAG: hypothetical protein B6D45_03460 [Ignavibacteriales bacterium UTCHB3]MBV6445183.1 hypothetical protein [Ignavibacteriaceae bacterium]
MKIFRSVIVFLLFSASSIFAQVGGFGAGIIVGEPTGLSAKLFLSKDHAIDAAVAWSFKKEAALHIHADYLYHDNDFLKVRSGRLPVYFGIGGRIKLQEKSRIGVRVPVGMAYEFPKAPFDIFLEIVPLLDIVPDTHFDFNSAIGVRYYFK